MMRIGNNRHRPWFLSMEYGVNPTLIKRVYLPMVELGQNPCRHMIKEYEGFLCSLMSSYLGKLLKHTHSVLVVALIEYFTKGVHEEVSYLVHNPITLHLTKVGPPRIPRMVKRRAQ